MILDKELIFSDAQVVTDSAASTDIYDQSVANSHVASEPYLVIQVREAATAAGAATVTFKLQTCAAEAFSSGVVDLYTSAAIGKDALTLNATPVKIRVPAGALQYLRVYYTVGTGPLTKGKFDAFLTISVD